MANAFFDVFMIYLVFSSDTKVLVDQEKHLVNCVQALAGSLRQPKKDWPFRCM